MQPAQSVVEFWEGSMQVSGVECSLVDLDLSLHIVTVLAFMCDCSASNTSAFCPEAAAPP